MTQYPQPHHSLMYTVHLVPTLDWLDEASTCQDRDKARSNYSCTSSCHLASTQGRTRLCIANSRGAMEHAHICIKCHLCTKRESLIDK